MNVLLLPLDSRPCNCRWPEQMLSHAGHTCIKPAPEDMDYFRRPAEFEAQRRFLNENANRADCFVLSVDKLCYGSLLASRDDLTDLKTAFDRLNTVKEIKRKYPSLAIHAVSVIMRASVSALCGGELSTYNNMSLYSLYSGIERYYCEKGNQKAQKHFAALAQRHKALMDEDTVKRYHYVRERNHALNMECVRMCADGTFSSLLLLQEDAAKYGFHTAEQSELKTLVRETGAKNAFLHNGADEGCCMAAMRAVNRDRIRLDIRYSYGLGGFTALYEDRPFNVNLADSLLYQSIRQDASAPVRLVIHAPVHNRQTEAAAQNECSEDINKTIALIRDGLTHGKKVYLLDVAYANGGSLRLISALKSEGLLSAIDGYSAWNTAGNSLGSMLSSIVSDSAAGCSDHLFKWERIIDDALYEAMLRQRLTAAVSEKGDDPLNLKDPNYAQNLLTGELSALFECENWPLTLKSDNPRSCPYTVTASLPWNRLFEVDIRVGNA